MWEVVRGMKGIVGIYTEKIVEGGRIEVWVRVATSTANLTGGAPPPENTCAHPYHPKYFLFIHLPLCIPYIHLKAPGSN